MYAAAAAKSFQSCPTLCDPIDGSPSGSAIPGILQARTLEWVAISFSNAWKWKVKVKSLSKCLHDPMDCSLPGSSVHGILEARVLEWVAIAFSGIYVYLWLIHIEVWQKATKFCKSNYPSIKNKAKLSIQKRKIIGKEDLVPSLHKWGNKCKQWQTLFYWAPKSLRTVNTAMKLKDSCSLEEKLWKT